MKQLLTSLLLGLSVLVSAQNDGWEYPYPYNPDGNADGYISLSDLLDLLVVYGQEFPQGLYSNTEGALLDLGEMDVFSCHLKVSLLEGNWTLPTSEDALNWLPSIGAVASTWFQEGGYTSAGWEYLCVDELGELKKCRTQFLQCIVKPRVWHSVLHQWKTSYHCQLRPGIASQHPLFRGHPGVANL